MGPTWNRRLAIALKAVATVVKCWITAVLVVDMVVIVGVVVLTDCVVAMAVAAGGIFVHCINASVTEIS